MPAKTFRERVEALRRPSKVDRGWNAALDAVLALYEPLKPCGWAIVAGDGTVFEVATTRECLDKRVESIYRHAGWKAYHPIAIKPLALCEDGGPSRDAIEDVIRSVTGCPDILKGQLSLSAELRRLFVRCEDGGTPDAWCIENGHSTEWTRDAERAQAWKDQGYAVTAFTAAARAGARPDAPTITPGEIAAVAFVRDLADSIAAHRKPLAILHGKLAASSGGARDVGQAVKPWVPVLLTDEESTEARDMLATLNRQDDPYALTKVVERFVNRALRGARDTGADTRRLDWLEQEHSRFDPVMRLAVKYKLDRRSAEWVNAVSARSAIDAAMSPSPEPTKQENENEKA